MTGPSRTACTGPRRDVRRGPEPDPKGLRAGGDGGAAQPRGGIPRTTGVTNIAAALRRNAARVDELFAKLGILKR